MVQIDRHGPRFIADDRLLLLRVSRQYRRMAREAGKAGEISKSDRYMRDAVLLAQLGERLVPILGGDLVIKKPSGDVDVQPVKQNGGAVAPRLITFGADDGGPVHVDGAGEAGHPDNASAPANPAAG